METQAIIFAIIFVIVMCINSERIKSERREKEQEEIAKRRSNTARSQQPREEIYRKQPTYEEWKASREKEQQETKEDTPSTYRLVGSEIPKDDTIIYSGTVKEKETTNEYKQPQEPILNGNTQEYQHGYQAASILTANERYNYKNLKIAAEKKGYIICPKVRLADVINPSRIPQNKSYRTRLRKIQSKHVDFVLYDSNMRYPKVVIELDDSSHRREDRRERDEFVDFILRDCGIKVIHTYNITPDILDNL